MPRKSLVHYIAPSAISITPNCNESANDLAVSLVRGAKIKVFSPDAGLETEDGYFQEWTLYGRNRRLADSAGNDGHRYTIYARLPKANKDGGYLVFAQMVKNEDDKWEDKYACVTSFGLSDVGEESEDYWYIRLGEVSEPEGGQRTVTLDTGILGTDQFNTEWNLVQEGLRVDLTCRLVEPYEPIPDPDPDDDEEPEPEGEDAGPTPYVPWGYWLFMKAELGGLREGEEVKIDHWEITRSTGAGSVDWMDEDDPRREQFEEKGRIDLKHTRGDGGTDDFDAAVSLAFTVTAWGWKHERKDDDDEEDEQEPAAAVQDGGGGGEGKKPEVLATAVITIMSETNEQYGLSLSDTIVNYDDENETFIPEKVFVRVRSTDQRSGVAYITAGQMAAARLAVQYFKGEYDNQDQEIWHPLVFEDKQVEPDYAEAFIGNDEETHREDFNSGENIVVRLVETETEEDEGGVQTVSVVKELSRQTILNYYNLDTKYVTVGFFKKLFAVHHITTESGEPVDEEIETNGLIDPDDTTVNIESKYGHWSPSYVSALGMGSGSGSGGGGGGGGGGDALEWPLLDINNAGMDRNPNTGDTIVYDPSVSGHFRWGASLDTTKLARWLQDNDYKKQADLDLRYLKLASETTQTVTGNLNLNGDLSILRTPITDFEHASESLVLTFGETKSFFDTRYVTVNWFKKVFATYRGTTKYDPNDAGVIAGTTILDNLKILVGTWTESYVSALGTGSQGGSGGVWYLSLLEDVRVGTLTPQDNGKALIYDSTQDKWVKGTAGIDTAELNRILQGKTLTITDGSRQLGNQWNAKDGGSIDISGILTGKSWWGATMNIASGVVTGTITVGDGDIILNNNKKIKWKKSSGTDSFSMLTLDNSNGTNHFIVGEASTANNGIDTYIRGNGIVFQTASGQIDASLSIPQNESVPVFYVRKLKIGSIVISEDTRNGGLHVENAGIYADTYVSSLGTGSDGSPGGLDLDLMWDALKTYDGVSGHKISNSYLNFNISNYALRTEIPSLSGYATESFVLANKYVHPTGGADKTITAASKKVLSSITVNDLGHVTAVGSKDLEATDIPNLSWNKITDDKPTTIDGYGITDAKIDADGVITLGNSTITPLTDAKLKSNYRWWGAQMTDYNGTADVRGDMTNVGSITVTAADYGKKAITGFHNISLYHNGETNGNGGHLDFFWNGASSFTSRISEGSSGRLDLNNTVFANYGGNVGIGNASPAVKLDVSGDIRVTQKIYFYKDASNSANDIYLEYVGSQGGVHLRGAGFYADNYVSSLGLGSDGSASSFDEEMMWDALGGSMQNKKIANSHLNFNINNYATTNDLNTAIGNCVATTDVHTLTLNVDGTDVTWNPLLENKRIVITASGDYLPLAGGEMDNTNLVTNMNADLLDGLHAASFMQCVNASTQPSSYFDSVTQSGIYRLGSSDGTTGSVRYMAPYGNLLMLHGHGDTAAQILFPYKTSTAYLRCGNPFNDSESASWRAWREIAFKDDLSDYAKKTDTVASADKWATARNFTIKDADQTNSGTAVSVDGSSANGYTLLLPSKIKATTFTGNLTGDVTGNVTGTASRLASTVNLWGNDFDGSQLEISGNIGLKTNGSRYHFINVYQNGTAIDVNNRVGFIAHDSGNATTMTASRWQFVCYRPKAADAPQDASSNGKYERFYLPAADAGVASNANYDILTTKDTTLWGQTFNGSVVMKGDLFMISAESGAALNTNSAKLKFNSASADPSSGMYRSPYIQAIGAGSHGRKRLSVFQSDSTDYSEAFVEAFTILTTGNVGIGTVTPSEKLEVSGNALIGGQMKASSYLSCHNGGGTSATGWVHIADITVTAASSQPLKFRVTQRLRVGGELTVLFSNTSTVGQTVVSEFFYTGDIVGANIVKTSSDSDAQAVFALYIRKVAKGDRIGISLVDVGAYLNARMTVTWTNEHWSPATSTQTPGGTAATCRYYFANDVYMEYDSANEGVHVVNAGLYANTYVSSLGAGSTGTSGSTNLMYPLSAINDANLSTSPADKSVIMYTGGKWQYQQITGSGTLKTIQINTATGLCVGTAANPTSTTATVTNSESGTFYLGFGGSVTANRVLASPNGSAGAPSWRELTADYITSGTFNAARIPNLSWNKITDDKPTTLEGYGIADDDAIFANITAGKASQLESTVKLWGNNFNGTQDIGKDASHRASLSYVGSISMDSTITGCTGMTVTSNARISQASNDLYLGKSDNSGWVCLADCCSQTSSENWALRNDGDARFLYVGINGVDKNYRLYVNGSIKATANSYFTALELSGNSATKIPYIDFHKGGMVTGRDYSSRIRESADGVLTICAQALSNGSYVSSRAGLVVGENNDGDYIKIGGATLTWVEGQGLKIDTGFWSESFVSSLGMGSGGSGGGIDMDTVWTYLQNNASGHSIGKSNDYLSSLYATNIYAGGKQVLTSDNGVTLTTEQTISGNKKFSGFVGVGIDAQAAPWQFAANYAYVHNYLSIGAKSTTYNLNVNGTSYFSNVARFNSNVLVSGMLTVGGVDTSSTGNNGKIALDADENLSITTGNYIQMKKDTYFSGKLIVGSPTKKPSETVRIGGSLSCDGSIYTYGTEVDYSDIRLKDVISDVGTKDLTVEMIARAPIFRFTWKDGHDTRLHIGTSAQYWQSVLPEPVEADEEGYLGLSYSQTALSAVVMTARTVMTHEEEIAALKRRLSGVEAENERLRNEIELLKAA